MVGIGKPTPAKFVYDDRAVEEWFDLKTWAHVSQVFDALKLTKDTLKGVGLSDCDTMTPEQLHCELENKIMYQAQWDFLITPLQSRARGKTFRSEIVGKRDGLPLAARSLGCLLKSRTDVEGWTEILESNVWKRRSEGVLPALRASYDDLPPYLKRFPRDGRMEMKLGYGYFQNLVSRSFFEQIDDHSLVHGRRDAKRAIMDRLLSVDAKMKG
uniref:NB-ARC domain-containing protein n=1 Tax=Salix viminalis TaxID=40686 RepID=A0A6N2NJG4_SALVM